MAKHQTSPCAPGVEPEKSRLKLARTSKTRAAPLTLTLPRSQLLDGSNLSHQQNQGFRAVFDGPGYLSETLFNNHHVITLMAGPPRPEGFLLNAPSVQGSASSEKFSADLSGRLSFMKKVPDVLCERAGKISDTLQTQPPANKFARNQQTRLQGAGKQDCTKPPIKDAQPALPCSAQDTNAAAHTNAATPAAAAAPANAAWGANAALNLTEEIRVLRPSHGTERPPIAPPHGTERTSPVPHHGTMHHSFTPLSVPPHGHHLEKPSVSGLKPDTSEKLIASHDARGITTLKGKQPNLFTGGAALCYIAFKPKGPVPEKHHEIRGSGPHLQAGFCHAQILGTGAPARIVPYGYGQDGAIRKDVRTTDLVFFTSCPPNAMKTQRVASKTRSGAKTMTAITKASRRAAPSPTTTGTPDLIQLHADAHNALNMAVFYLRQPDANVAGARRKAIQALSALRGLSLALEG